MANMTFFHYVHKDTILHKMDPRVKLLCMLILSIAIGLSGRAWQHIPSLLLLVVALVISRLSIASILRDVRLLAPLMLITILSNTLRLAIPGLIFGLTFSLRLLLIIILCAVVTGTTSLLSLRSAIEWYLRPIPFVPEVSVSTMINLTFTLIPLIMDTYSEMMDAQNSRLIGLSKNPVRRLKLLAFPLLTQMLINADNLCCAMESRCYSEKRTAAVFKATFTDVAILAVCGAVLIFVLV